MMFGKDWLPLPPPFLPINDSTTTCALRRLPLLCTALSIFWSILLGNAQRVALHEFDKTLKAVASRLSISMLSWEIDS
jgi:hypothetical protein